MKIRSLLLTFAILLSTVTIVRADGIHDHPSLHGGRVFVAKDIDVELATNGLKEVVGLHKPIYLLA